LRVLVDLNFVPLLIRALSGARALQLQSVVWPRHVRTLRIVVVDRQ
jgi:hypothetical protein